MFAIQLMNNLMEEQAFACTLNSCEHPRCRQLLFRLEGICKPVEEMLEFRIAGPDHVVHDCVQRGAAFF